MIGNVVNVVLTEMENFTTEIIYTLLDCLPDRECLDNEKNILS